MSTGKYRKEHICLNCGSYVEKHYCSDCGQPNIELKESFWGFIGHSIAHYFHFDSKFFQTISPLLTKPGMVTLDYIAGKRARYINPVNLYIFVSIVYFLIVPAAREEHTEKDNVKAKAVTAASLDNVQTRVDKAGNLKGELKYVLDRAKIEGVKYQYDMMSFAAQGRYLDSLRKIRPDSSSSKSLNDLITSLERVHEKRRDSTYDSYLFRQKHLPEAERDNWFERQLKKQDIKVNVKSAKGNWTIGEEVKKYEPKQYFLLMPLLAFFIMINFRKNHIYYLDHLIFTIHGMTAYFIVSIVTYPVIKYIFGIGSFMGTALGFGIFVWVCWYLYTGLRVFYKRSKGKTIGKMISLFFLYAFSLYLTEALIRNLIYFMMT
ncbi:MAG: DUF3667 domain-containing protein [Pedobacter sp.]